METRKLSIPWVLQAGYEPVASDLLRVYFSPDRPYTGAHFETLGGLWSATDRYAITPADIVAVSTLSVDVPAGASIRLLGDDSATVTALLREIPTDLDLVHAADEVIGPGSAASRLWELLRAYPGMGQTKTSKLMARKRPGLIPIYDSVVKRVLEVPDSSGHWAGLRAELQADGRALHERALRLRKDAGLGDHVTALRVIDVVLWMHGKEQLNTTTASRSEAIARERGPSGP